jgi:hypothetical protein
MRKYDANFAGDPKIITWLIKKLSPYCPKAWQDQSLINALIDQKQRWTIGLFLKSANDAKTLTAYCNWKITAYVLTISMLNQKSTRVQRYSNGEIQKSPLELYNQYIFAHSANPRISNNFTSQITFNLPNTTLWDNKQKDLLWASKQLFAVVYNETLIKLVQDNIFSSWEIPDIIKKTVVNFSERCDFIHGLTEVEIITRYPENIMSTWLTYIQYNINVCNDSSYLASEIDKHLQSLIVHELWHYHYYLKNKNVSNFDSICWDNIWTPQLRNKCTRNDFVSDYSMWNNEEDYAETFQFWYLRTYPTNSSVKLIEKKAQFEPYKTP